MFTTNTVEKCGLESGRVPSIRIISLEKCIGGIKVSKLYNAVDKDHGRSEAKMWPIVTISIVSMNPVLMKDNFIHVGNCLVSQNTITINGFGIVSIPEDLVNSLWGKFLERVDTFGNVRGFMEKKEIVLEVDPIPWFQFGDLIPDDIHTLAMTFFGGVFPKKIKPGKFFSHLGAILVRRMIIHTEPILNLAYILAMH